MTITTKNKFLIPVILLLFISAWLQIGDYAVTRYFPILLATLLISIIYLYIGFKKSRKLTQFTTINLLSNIVFIIISFIGNSPLEEFIFDVVKVTLAFISAILFYHIINKETIRNIHISLLSIAVISVLIMLIVLFDSYSNFSISLFLTNFHQFKTDTIFFVDTNAVAIYGLITFSILLYYQRNILKSKTIQILLFIHFILIIACLSRAAIAGLLALLIYDRFRSSNNKVKILYSVLIVIALSYLFGLALELLRSDGSGTTKLNIYYALFDKLPNMNIRGIFFGQGINEGNYTYSYEIGKYSHALIPMIIGQFGIIGFIIYGLYFTYGMISSKYQTLYILLPLFVTGLSYLHPFLETIFIGNSIILAMNNKVWDGK